MNTVLRILRSPLISTLVVCILLYAFGCWKYKGFGSAYTFVGFLQQNAHLGLIAVGVTFVILAGGIDLSVGSAIGFGSVVMALLMDKSHGWPPMAAMAVVVAMTTVVGGLMGAIVHGFAVPPFLITLAGLFFYRGMALVITLQEIAVDHPGFDGISNMTFEPFPRVLVKPQLIMLLAIMVIAALVLRFTRFGRNVYAVGGNEGSALLMGLPVARTKVSVYALSGLCAGLAAIATLLIRPTGRAANGEGMELDAIAVVVIGGTLLTGGVGSIWGTLLGVLIYAIIEKIVTFQSLNTAWTHIAVGGLLLAFILLQKVLRAGKRE
jgi:simple sugar transport system permease protein